GSAQKLDDHAIVAVNIIAYSSVEIPAGVAASHRAAARSLLELQREKRFITSRERKLAAPATTRETPRVGNIGTLGVLPGTLNTRRGQCQSDVPAVNFAEPTTITTPPASRDDDSACLFKAMMIPNMNIYGPARARTNAGYPSST
ncbi:unnamed protein product, partial [Sphacelaria rigidula]